MEKITVLKWKLRWVLNEDQYGELIQLQNIQPPVEHDVSSRNDNVISTSDTTSATPFLVQL